MKKQRRIVTKLIVIILVSMIAVSFLTLLASSISEYNNCRKIYNEKTLEIAGFVAKSVDGDYLSTLHDAVTSPEFREIIADRTDDGNLLHEEEAILWLQERNLYDEFVQISEQLTQICTDMHAEYIYIQVIEPDGTCITLVDPSESIHAVGYTQELTGAFAELKSNTVVNPTISFSSYGYLSSGGMPIYDKDNVPIAIAFCDTNMTEIFLSSARYIGINFLFCIFIVAASAMIISKIARKQIANPIVDLTKAAKEFGTDESSYNKDRIVKLDIHTQDEIEELYHTTRSMQESIIDYMDNLTRITAEKERIGAELDVATKIQASMLPSTFPAFPDRDEFDIYAAMYPAKEVGGDFYDFFMIDEDHLGLVIADVSGKGVPAALFMMMSRIIINNYAQMGMSPSEVLARTNNRICEGNSEEMFVTVWFGILEISSGHVVAANAGHEYPILKSADGKFEIFEEPHDFVIGAMEDMPYSQYEFDIEHGGSLFLYTDGCPEATNASDELFEYQRMLDSLNQDPNASPKALLDSMKESVDAFVMDAPQFDDLTMLAVTLR